MQILFLVEDKEGDWEEVSKKLASILKYDKALTQNFILTDRSYISNSATRKCLILNTNQIVKKVILAPSLIINLYEQESQLDIEKYFRVKWLNTQFTFWSPQNIPKKSYDEFINEEENQISLVYTTNLEEPNFKLIQDSVKEQKYSALLEQAITEYFADTNLFKTWKLNQNNKILKNLSSFFAISYNVIEENADYTIKINSVTTMTFFELYSLNIEYMYEYLDALFKFRMDYYIDQVILRQYIIKLCKEQGITFEPSLVRTFIVSKDDKLGLQRSFFGGVNDLKGIDIVNDKHLTNVILKEKGFKTNISYEYLLPELNDENVINNISLEYPLVLKPTDKKKGYGVVTNILNPKKMLFSVKELMSLGDIKPVIIEEFFVGMTYRVLVVGAEVIAVIKFMPTYIIGNGKLSIKELILSKNTLLRSRIRINDALELGLLNDNYTYDSVLKDGHKYILSHNSHASMGGQATNVTDIFSEKLKQISCEVTKSLGLSHTGIDMNVNANGDYRILEVNCAPALSAHLYPKYGTPVDTYTKVLAALFNHTDLEKEDNKYLPELMEYQR